MIVAGILTPLEDLLTWVLTNLHDTVGLSWGWSIVTLVVIVRMLLVPLTVRQIHSMQNLQAHMPEMKEIQKRWKHDRQRQNEELMRFYKENKINPASSCLPIVLQIPIFISLFYVLRGFEKEIFPLYPASDLGFLGIVPNITDPVNSHWSGWLLLVVYVASQLVAALLTPVTDKTQRIIFIVLPFAFVFFIVNFPVGLLLYWVTTNLWTVGQGLITRRLVPRTPRPPSGGGNGPKRSSRTPKPEEPAPAPKSAPKPAVQQQPRRVKRKKGGARR
jgi:YidC/Oxa1 family membrane protein insertase